MSDRVIIRPITETEKVRDSGIVLTVKEDSLLDDLAKGEVLAVGGGKITEKGIIPMTVKVGDIILYNKRVPQMFKSDDGETLLTFRETEVAFILTNKN